MVSELPAPTRRQSPEYDLNVVHQLAANEKIHYAGDRVYFTTLSMGFELPDVCRCLQQLSPAHFHESLRYGPRQHWQDVYLITTVSPTGETHDLYIKFKIFGSQLMLFVCSFHPENDTND